MGVKGATDSDNINLVAKIQRLLDSESLMGAVVLLKSLNPEVASEALESLPLEDRKKLSDVWLGSGEALLAELPVQTEPTEKIADDNQPESVPFFPDHFVSQVTAVLWVICLISVLTIFSPAGLESKADPLHTPSGVKPEWYFLFLYSLLRFVPPSLGVLALMAGGILLTLLPFLDRNPDIEFARRKLALASCAALLAAIVALSFISVFGEG